MWFKKFIALLALLIGYGYAQASPFYQVEAIIFQQGDENPSTETRESAAIPSLAEAHILHNALPTNELDPYSILPKKQWQLTKQEWALQHKGKKRILFHTSWIQPISESTSTAIRIQGGHIYNNEGEVIADIDSHHPYDNLITDPTELIGSFTFTQKNFIHAQVNLAMQTPQDNGLVTTSHLKQRQRMKENELHYFDNPQLGVLVKVMPYSPTLSSRA